MATGYQTVGPTMNHMKLYNTIIQHHRKYGICALLHNRGRDEVVGDFWYRGLVLGIHLLPSVST